MRSKTTRGSLEPLPGSLERPRGWRRSGLAHRLTGGGASEGDPGDEIRERLDLMEERLQRLEDEVRALREGGESAPEESDGARPGAGPRRQPVALLRGTFYRTSSTMSAARMVSRPSRTSSASST